MAKTNEINYWSVFANMLGVEFNQKFFLRDKYGVDKHNVFWVDEQKGLLRNYGSQPISAPSPILMDIMNRNLVIEKKNCHFNAGDYYFYYDFDSRVKCLSLEKKVWENTLEDFHRYKIKNAFETKEVAKENIDNILEYYNSEKRWYDENK